MTSISGDYVEITNLFCTRLGSFSQLAALAGWICIRITLFQQFTILPGSGWVLEFCEIHNAGQLALLRSSDCTDELRRYVYISMYCTLNDYNAELWLSSGILWIVCAPFTKFQNTARARHCNHSKYSTKGAQCAHISVSQEKGKYFASWPLRSYGWTGQLDT